ncbi:NAD-dependent epimerase/dehydratase family protein [Nocardia yunnanensis]|uniref:NAD-dependent epimerase/dehydratase family protein n=1 Tax=Nocardia yunnanensis TaxID=2382165 RepID=A0A386ZPT1_9NOCA|nr:NAD(P)H-binding protein [Nocardia yunnanensis]AYF79373.1 NAD-dependent epimerase/dehydratase family protein [Nocardia yunnanensis]
MQITVFGASGDAGSRIVTEALRRGHQVRAVARHADRLRALPEQVEVWAADATDPAQVEKAAAGSEVVISATRPAVGREHELAEVAAALLEGLADSASRLLVVGGAGSLLVPGTGLTLADQPDFPAYLIPIATAGARQLETFRETTHQVDWLYLSPAALFEPGERTGAYRLGADEMLVDEAGNSSISMEDMAIAVLDQAERPGHHRTRITVGY